MTRTVIVFTWMLLLAAIAGCAGPLGGVREQARDRGWRDAVISHDDWQVQCYLGPGAGAVLTVYLEGDGRAWPDRSTPPATPTPRDPVGLRLALADPGAPVAYAARPCQYVDSPRCGPELWTSARYGDTVLGVLDGVLDRLKAAYRAKVLRLAGYSGGGALAVLLGSRRDDVVAVLTAGAPLDIRVWAEGADLTPLTGSRNPARENDPCLPQVHYFGRRDTVAPLAVGTAFIAGQPRWARASAVAIEDLEHGQAWSERWPELAALGWEAAAKLAGRSTEQCGRWRW